MKEVRIDDLREPRRSADEQAVYDYGLRLDVDLSVDGIIAEAQAATGLDEIADVAVYGGQR